jgi:hypothetical protein
MRFFTVAGRISGRFPSAGALLAEPFATQQATDSFISFISDRRQRLAMPAVFRQFGSLVRVDFVLLFDCNRGSNDRAFLHIYKGIPHGQSLV